MNDYLQKILTIAEENVKSNPSIAGKKTHEVARQYLGGLGDEVDEVADELKDNNVVHLQDELGDIVWDYFVLLKICEERGWIDSVDAVFEHASKKYAERAPAFVNADEVMWEDVKRKQKEVLRKQNADRYGL